MSLLGSTQAEKGGKRFGMRGKNFVKIKTLSLPSLNGIELVFLGNRGPPKKVWKLAPIFKITYLSPAVF